MKLPQPMPEEPAEEMDFKPLLRNAYIPFRYHNEKFAKYDAAGLSVQAYLGETGQYFNDCDDNRGVTMIGSITNRVALFPMLARSLVLRRDEVQYVQLSDLADWLDSPEDANERITKLYRIPALFVDDFYDASVACRYGPRELRRIEALIRTRIGNNRRMYVSSDSSDGGMTWYSAATRQLLQEHTRIIAV